MGGELDVTLPAQPDLMRLALPKRDGVWVEVTADDVDDVVEPVNAALVLNDARRDTDIVHVVERDRVRRRSGYCARRTRAQQRITSLTSDQPSATSEREATASESPTDEVTSE